MMVDGQGGQGPRFFEFVAALVEKKASWMMMMVSPFVFVSHHLLSEARIVGCFSTKWLEKLVPDRMIVLPRKTDGPHRRTYLGSSHPAVHPEQMPGRAPPQDNPLLLYYYYCCCTVANIIIGCSDDLSIGRGKRTGGPKDAGGGGGLEEALTSSRHETVPMIY